MRDSIGGKEDNFSDGRFFQDDSSPSEKLILVAF
jgi:hypothetical protein